MYVRLNIRLYAKTSISSVSPTDREKTHFTFSTRAFCEQSKRRATEIEREAVVEPDLNSFKAVYGFVICKKPSRDLNPSVLMRLFALGAGRSACSDIKYE